MKGRGSIIKNDKSGTTMVEVIVAFAILVMILGVFSHTMEISGKVMNRSGKQLKDIYNLAGSYYLEGDGDMAEDGAKAIKPTVSAKSLNFQSEDGKSSFSINVKVRQVGNASGIIRDVIPN